MDTIKALINKTSSKARLQQIHLAYDNGEMGQKYEEKTKSLIEEIGHNDKIIKKELSCKDWNEELINKINNQQKKKKKKDYGISF